MNKRKVDQITKKYNFSYELERSKTINQKNKLLKIMPYSKNNKINKPYLVKGRFPKNNGEITILPEYAKNP